MTPKFVNISLTFSLKVTLQTAKFRPIFAHSASTVRASKNVQLALIGSLPCAFQRAIDEPCTLPLSLPKGGTKTRFRYFFPVNFNFCWKKSAAKFLRVKTSSSKVVATSLLCLTVNRCIAGDFPIYQKIALKVTHPFRKRRFRQIFKFGVAIHLFVAGNRRHFKLNMWVVLAYEWQNVPKWAWPCHVTHFRLLVSLRYLRNGLS